MLKLIHCALFGYVLKGMTCEYIDKRMSIRFLQCTRCKLSVSWIKYNMVKDNGSTTQQK